MSFFSASDRLLGGILPGGPSPSEVRLRETALNPFNARNPATLPLRAATWTALQVPAAVGGTLWGIGEAFGVNVDTGAKLAAYERNLAAGLGFTRPDGSVRPTLSGPTNSVPFIGPERVGDAAVETFTFLGDVAQEATGDVLGLLPPWLLPVVAVGGVGAALLYLGA